ncbi:MAG: hypothetical protein ACM3SW_08870 [Actinomycetota bacterium]
MSDFLFRMIERAAGGSSVPVPQPPPQYQWPALLDRPAPVPVSGSAALPTAKTAAPVSLSPAAPHSFGTSMDALDRASSPAFTTPQFAGGTMETELAPEAIGSEKTRLITPSEKDPIQSVELAQVKVPEAARRPAPLRFGPDTRFQISHPAIEDGASLRDSFHEPDPVREKPAIVSGRVAEFSTVQQAHGPERTSPAPALPPARAERADRSLPPGRQEAPDPVVEVSIARVDVRLDAPKQAAPQPVSRPRGFAEYESLRRYITSPWARRR